MDSGSAGSRIGGIGALSRIAGGPRVTEVAPGQAVTPSGNSPDSHNDQPPRRDDRDREEPRGERFEIAAETNRLLIEAVSEANTEEAWRIPPEALVRLYGELQHAADSAGPASFAEGPAPGAVTYAARQLRSRAYAADGDVSTPVSRLIAKTV